MSNAIYQRLDELLEKRPIPFIGEVVKLQIRRISDDVSSNTDGREEADENDENENDENENEETILIEQHSIIPFNVLDKRRNSNMLDRLAIIKRIQNEEEDKSMGVVDTETNQFISPSIITGKTLTIPKSITTIHEEHIETDNSIEDIPTLVIEESVSKDTPQKLVQPKTKSTNPPKLKIKQKTMKGDVTNDAVDITTAVIRTQKVIDRLPKERDKVIIKAPSYYMSNRKIYMQKIAGILAPYQKELLDSDNKVSCDNRGGGTEFELLTHQKIVRDYLNLYTPYRGLLLYHGLGSGKTCTSIAIAEGMKSDKQIIVMTPAALKMNFFSEMKKCGDELYKKNQYWEFISIDGNPSYVGILSRALSLSTEYIQSNKGAWLVNINKESNFTALTTREQDAVDNQLNSMIRTKYTTLNYNGGIHTRKLKEITGDYSRNPFDNAVIIIDEAHNFVSRIVNKIKDHDSISYKLYNYLLSATNAKVILLTGTPIINYPNEIGILYNILRGYITTWTIPISWDKTDKLNSNAILDMLNNANFNTYDYVDFSDNKLTITRNPFGFINMKKRGVLKGNSTRTNRKTLGGQHTRRVNKQIGGGDVFDRYNGVQLDERGNITDAQFLESIKRILRIPGNDVNVKDAQIEIVRHKALPDERDPFFNSFIDVDNDRTKNINTFQRRILGLTSYFRSAQEDLLPSFVKTENDDLYHVIKTPMTEHQFSVYEAIRKEEADREKKTTKMKRMQVGKATDMYNISSTYRVFSRAACNFTFPPGIIRPIPVIKDDTEVDENVFDAGQNTIRDEVEPDDELETEPIVDDSYATRIDHAMKDLNRTHDGNNDSLYLSSDALPTYSPKFAKILENIMDTENEGLHLLYSHFRTMEGIGILRLVFLANGMAEFKIKRDGDTWTLDIKEEDIDKPKFVLYTGTETAEEKEIIRNVYNGTWELVPQTIVDKLEERSKNNIYGEVIKVIMITSSGAEGINLRNTRFVHIVEPYWHMVRVEQVVGRARRICSHQDLPEEMRTVKVFLYVSMLSDKQKTDTENIELRIRDISKVDQKTPVTTDESLYEIASAKQRINNEILRAVKETAVDCNIYSALKTGKDVEQYVCYGHGQVESNQYSSYPSFEQDVNIKEGLDTTVNKIKAIKKTIDGTDYAMDKNTKKLYDLESFKRAQSGLGQALYVGDYSEHNGKPFIRK
jgi:hypothetical protein